MYTTAGAGETVRTVSQLLLFCLLTRLRVDNVAVAVVMSVVSPVVTVASKVASVMPVSVMAVVCQARGP